MERIQRLERHIRQLVHKGLRIVVVVPCYNVEGKIIEVVQTIPDYIYRIVLVDDASEDRTADIIDGIVNQRVIVIHLSQNQGVGGAMFAGFRKAFELSAHIIAKMDGDGQMDPAYLPALVAPLIRGKADYAKGNRFQSTEFLATMPPIRQFGNSILSLLTKSASGYWNIFDPTNGFVAIRREVLELIPEKMIHPRFFFESSMLIALRIVGAVVADVPMMARYRDEKSNLKISAVVFQFPIQLTRGFFRRILLTKFIYSLTVEAILMAFGLLFLAGGVVFGLVNYIHYGFILHTPAPSGTVMAAVLPILLGFQMLMNAVLLDIQSVPVIPIAETFVLEDF